MNQVKPKLMLDERKEKKNKKLMLLFCIVFFVLAFVSQGQTMKIVRTHNVNKSENKAYVCKVPNSYIKLVPLNAKDTLFLSIIADSIRQNVYSIMLFCTYTKGLALPVNGIKIWYSDMTTDEFDVFEFDKEYRMVEYNIVGTSFSNMFRKKVIAVDVKGVVYYENIDGETYFKDFLSLYDK